MDDYFRVTTKIDRWLRQQYGAHPDTRVFWNQIMVTAGVIHLRQLNLPITQGNLERYTPIKPSSIYRTLSVLESCDILEKIGTEPDTYDFKGNVPTDILELSTNSTKAELNGIINELKTLIKQATLGALRHTTLAEEDIETVMRQIDEVQPEKKKLDPLSDIVGDGFQ